MKKEIINAEPVLFIPALALSSKLYTAQMNVLSKKHDIFIGDHTQDNSFEAMAQRILQTAPDHFALIGLSMGGYAAFEIFRQAPNRVTRLALLDTNFKSDTLEKSENRQRQIALALAGKYESLFEIMWEGLVAPEHWADEHLKDHVFSMMRTIGAESFIRQQQAIMTRKDNTSLLPTIHVPTLVLVGENDTLTPPEIARDMAQRIPDAALKIIPRCGHLSSLEQPDKVTTALQDWLEPLSRKRVPIFE